MPNALRFALRTRLFFTSLATPSTFRRRLLSLAILLLLVAPALIIFTQIVEALQTGSGTVSLTTLGSAYTQDFNTLANSGTSGSLPSGWYFEEALANANNLYTAGTGSANAGDTYSFGAAASSERAFGGLRSGTLAPTLGASFTNNTGSTVTTLAISYTGEEWRLGTAGRTDRLDFQISTNATSLTTGIWTDKDLLDFTTPFTTTTGPLDGNAAANRAAISSTITGLSIPNGATFFIRWNDLDASGADDGLAIDTFSLTPSVSGDPTATASATPNPVDVGNSTLLTVNVTPGTNPTSTGITVTGNLTSIGGSATQTFFDNATNGDVTSGDNIFSFQATVPANNTGGPKNLPISVVDAQARTASTNISLTVIAPSSPSVAGAANPATVGQGGSTLLTGTVTPGTVPTSTGLAVTGNLSSIGGSGSQTFYDDGSHGDAVAGNNVFSFQATVDVATTVGNKTIPLSVTDTQARSGSGSISLNVTQPPVAAGTIVISQIYGGGGNVEAPYTNDFIEIFNRSNTSVNLAGWSVQYASSAGSSWQTTALSGVIAPGQYYLVREGAGSSCSGSPCGVPLPAFDVSGGINMAAASGKVAVVSSTSALSGTCATGPNVNDFVGYGGANCFEGAAAAPGMDNVTSDFRTHLGCKDTDSNGGNFVSGAPNPRTSSSPFNVCSGGDFPPEIFNTSPGANEAHVPLDSNITIDFDEAVNVSGSWFQISCTNTGIHTASVSGGPISFTLNPDSDFTFNEPCTVTVFATQVSDQDVNDPPDNMQTDYTFTFNSEFFRDPAEHMVMGNPSNATPNTANSTNFLMMKIQYALSYNDSRGTPNWTSWHLDSTWRGSAPRQDDFRADTTLPPGYHQVQGGGVPGEVSDYSGSGFDRGHMCPSADRTSTIADNSATFLMTNMVPQGPGNNQGPWAALENSLRTFLPGNEIYIISGGSGVGGVGKKQDGTIVHADTIANGHVTVPAFTWKVALILPVGDTDVSRVDGNTRTIAVIMPNDDAIRPDQWQKYLATVDQVEALSGYDFYSNVPPATQDVFEAKLDAPNDTAPVTSDQNKTTAEDASVAVTLAASDFNVNNVFTFTIVDEPLHGSVSCTAGNCTYSPNPHYFGSDQFTYKANDGALDSNVSTVFVNVTEVNNDPSAVNDSKATAEDSVLKFAATDLTGNDSPGPNEGSQTLTVDAVVSTLNTHGNVVLSSGQITYTPDTNYNGPASFDYHMCDDGTTNGAADPKCATGTVNVTVTEVNDTPSAANDSKTTDEDTQLSFAASDLTGNDSAGPANESGQTLTVSSVTATANTHGTVSLSNGQVVYTPAGNYNGPASFEYQVCDNGTTNSVADPKCATGIVNVTVGPVQDAPDAVDDAATINEDSGANTISVLVNDTDADADTLSVSAVTQGTHGSVTNNSTSVSYTPNANFFGTDTFTYTVSDGNGGNDTATVTVTVTNVQDAPDAVNDAATINEDSGANSIDVRANDSDVDGDTLTVTAVTQGTHGSVAITGGGTGVSYTPAANFFGTDTFTYTISDGNGGTDTATVTVTVTNVEDAPDAVDDAPTINEDSGANIISVLVNDTDADNDALTVSAVTQGTHGSVTNNSTSVSYTPNANFFGTDTFTYTISDGHGGFDTANVNVTVNNVNDAPVATNDAYSTNSNATLNVPAPGVLANDSDIDSPSLSSQLVSNVSHGTLALQGDGSFSYTPSLDFEGTDSFTYHAYDGAAYSNVVTVTITVHDTVAPVLTSSVAISLISSTNSNLVNVGLAASATDNSGDPVTIQVAVFGDEDDETPTANNTVHSPDAKDIAPITLRLRGERVEANDGRVYLIIITATDSSGNVSRSYQTVVVPKSNKQANIDSVNAQAAGAKSYAQDHAGTPPPGYFVIGDGPIIGPKQ